MGFIFGLLFFILFIGLFIVLAILGFIRSLFGFGGRKASQQQYEQAQSKSAEKPKIFTEKEGEYVDFEEIE